MNNIPDVIILAGGLGTRLRSVIGENKQKVIVDVLDKPFILYILDELILHKFERIILALGYQSKDVIDCIERSGYKEKISIIYSIENKPMGTAGAIKNAESVISTNTILVINGDTFSKIDYGEILKQYRNREMKYAILVHKVLDGERYGTVEFCDTTGQINSFSEKKSKTCSFVSIGVYLLSVDFLKSLSLGKYSLEVDIFPNLILNNIVFAIRQDTDFLDIGIPETLKHSSEFLYGDK